MAAFTNWGDFSNWLGSLDPGVQQAVLSNPKVMENMAGPMGMSSATQAGGGGGIFGNLFGEGGGLGNIMGGLGSLGQLYGAYKSLGFMNDQLDFQKNAFDYQKGFAEREYENRRKDYNRQLEDRQRVRLAFSGQEPGGYDSLDTYMSKHGA